jgi:uncharacterized membrane protein YeaQ/YmgE (transglycosylase-associated protein family)
MSRKDDRIGVARLPALANAVALKSMYLVWFSLSRRTTTFASGGHCAEVYMSILWTIIIGFVAGVIAKLLHPGPNEPSGFVLTTILGIVGALVATYLGQAIGWYNAGEGAGLVGAIVGAIIVLVVWGFLAPRDRRTA